MDNENIAHLLIYLIIMPLMFLFSILILPPYLLYKLIINIFGWFCYENMNEKVVLITGASPGIGEQMAYDYAKRGARLVIVGRRKSRLLEVADMARQVGSPNVLPVCADVSNIEDCKSAVDEGVIYPTHFAIPHLRRSKGRIIVISSGDAMMHLPRMSFYCASKAAVLGFFEVLRVEFAPHVKISIVTPGFIDSEMTQGTLLSADGILRARPDFKDIIPPQVLMTAANAIVRVVCRGERLVTEPKWYKVFPC